MRTFTDIKTARAAYHAAKQAWWDAQAIERGVANRTKWSEKSMYTLVTETAVAYAEVLAVKADAIAQFADPEKARYESGLCSTCMELQVFPDGPRHEASSGCESGKHPHCSCDACY